MDEGVDGLEKEREEINFHLIFLPPKFLNPKKPLTRKKRNISEKLSDYMLEKYNIQLQSINVQSTVQK